MKKYILLLMMTFITKGFAQQKTSANPIHTPKLFN
jgi:hypothetical protein